MSTQDQDQFMTLEKSQPLAHGEALAKRFAFEFGGEWSFDEGHGTYHARQIDELGQKWELMIFSLELEAGDHINIGWHAHARYYTSAKSYISWVACDFTPARRDPREAIALAKEMTITARDASLKWHDILKRQRYTGSPITPEAKRKASRPRARRARAPKPARTTTQLSLFP